MINILKMIAKTPIVTDLLAADNCKGVLCWDYVTKLPNPSQSKEIPPNNPNVNILTAVTHSRLKYSWLKINWFIF